MQDMRMKKMKNMKNIGFERIGECEPEKCGAACCNCLVRDPNDPKDKGMSTVGSFRTEKVRTLVGEIMEILIWDRPCGFLDKTTLRCKQYSKRPTPCRFFPQPHDVSYLYMQDTCTYKFVPKLI